MQALALNVLGDLAIEEEYLPFGGGILVDQLPSGGSFDPGCDRYAVSFGTRDGQRLVEVAVGIRCGELRFDHGSGGSRHRRRIPRRDRRADWCCPSGLRRPQPSDVGQV
jgi:hypothetical protein